MNSSKSKHEEYQRLQNRLKIKKGLPHLFSFKFYPFMRKFWDCWQTYLYTFAPNQVGKSSIMIRRMVHICTEPDTWKMFARRPRLTFYFYPDKNTIKREIETKWPEFLPQNGYEDSDKYGFKIKWSNGYPDRIEWNSGVITYFITYGTSNLKESVMRIQASTPAICACDEVLPKQLVDEVVARVSSPMNKGAMLWQNCTPTRFEKYLKDIQDGTKVMPDSMVQTISLKDCMFYEDGSQSPWTQEEIDKKYNSYSTKREVQIRCEGLFAPAEGRAYPTFIRDTHFQPRHPLPKEWELYCGIDYGSGGKTGHPSAIAIIAVSPDYSKGRVVKFCRMDSDRWPDGTTEDDVINQYLEMCQELKVPFIPNTCYDWACSSMNITAANRGITLQKANKNRDQGKNLLNSLFKNQMLIIYEDDEMQAEKLCDELEELLDETDKKIAEDDGIDALRYCAMMDGLVWNFKNINVVETKTKTAVTRKVGRQVVHDFEDELHDESEDEIDEWNEIYGE